MINVLLATLIVLTSFLGLSLYNGVAKSKGNFQLVRITGVWFTMRLYLEWFLSSWYLIIPYILSIVHPALGILAGCGGTLMCHARDKQHHRNFLVLFSALTLFALLVFVMIVFYSTGSLLLRDVWRPYAL